MNACKLFVLPTVALSLLALMPLGAAQAQVAVTSADPASAPQGMISLDVTVNGNGFDSSAQVEFLVTGTTNPGGITVKKVAVRGSKKLIATIDIADTAVVTNFDIQVALSGGRKGKGTSLFAVLLKPNSDPCAVAGLDFPAFAFWRQSGTSATEFLVADSTGKCVRSVHKSATGTGPTIQFSYPVAGALNRGRLAWNEYDSVSGPTVVGMDFTVDTATNQLTVFSKTIIHAGTGGYITLSRDGNALYTITHPIPEETVIYKYALSPVGAPLGPPATAFEAPAGSFVGTISVNGADTVIFADFQPAPGPPTTPRQLVWIPLDASNSYHVIDSHDEQLDFSPAAHPSSDLVVYQDAPSAGSCDPLVVKEIGGATVLYPLQPAYGRLPTWLNGMVLADGREWVRNKGCRYSGTIMQLDPGTGVRTALTTGYSPDGR
jgi:hypothetical protein